MKSEDIVVGLDMAKKLREAGWPQLESVFYWQWFEDDGEWPTFDGQSEWYCAPMEASYEDYDEGECFAAPTVDELISEIARRMNAPMSHVLSIMGSLMFHQKHQGILADFVAHVFCESVRLGTLKPDPSPSL
jgi:hypothetical protein